MIDQWNIDRHNEYVEIITRLKIEDKKYYWVKLNNKFEVAKCRFINDENGLICWILFYPTSPSNGIPYDKVVIGPEINIGDTPQC